MQPYLPERSLWQYNQRATAHNKEYIQDKKTDKRLYILWGCCTETFTNYINALHWIVWVTFIVTLFIVKRRTFSDTNFFISYFYFILIVFYFMIIVYYRYMYMATPDSC